MSFNLSTHKLIKSLSPFILADIVTSGLCSDEIREAEENFIKNWGDPKFKWSKDLRIENSYLYISDSGFSLNTSRKRAKELESKFKDYPFIDVWSTWYGGNIYRVGILYTHENFENLYKTYNRNKLINHIIQ